MPESAREEERSLAEAVLGREKCWVLVPGGEAGMGQERSLGRCIDFIGFGVGDVETEGAVAKEAMVLMLSSE